MEAHSSIIAGLESWLCRQPELGDRCHIVDVAVPKTGFSADTFLIDMEGCATGAMGKRALVVRIERPGRNTFLGTSIVKQARMMQALSNHGISVPAIVGWEENASLIGGSFLVMDRISGVSLPMHPSYHVAGLLHELDPATRREAWFGAINTISQINKLPWREGFGFLHNSEYGAPGLDAYLGWLGAWRDMACAGEKHPVVDAAMAYLHEHRPRSAEVELLWGDSNPGNFLFFGDGRIAAAVDFEASAVGPAEIDLSWWFFVDEMVSDGRPLLTGMPTRAEQIDAFEVALGRPVANLDYYAKLSGVRMSLVMARTVRNLIADGLLAPDNSGWLVNPASSVLAGMMGLADPGSNDDYMRVVAVMNRR